jgi:DNA-binding XRE family transcriptional regulator
MPMKTYKIEEVEDILLGTRGTTQREYYEQELDEFYIGEAIRKARLSKNLTQEELGARIGVQRAQISRIEKGKNITLANISRLMKAMEIQATLSITGVGTFVL